MQLKALSQEGREFIVHERSKGGPFTDFNEFLHRAGAHLHLQDARVLIKAGCFDSIAGGLTRPSLIWRALRFYNGVHLEENSPALFSVPPAILPVKHPPYPKHLMLKHELDTLGFPLSYHPLERYGNILKNLAYTKACDLPSHVGQKVRAIGWPVTGKTILAKDGNPMKFISFEDTTGLYETVLFSTVYHRFCHLLSSSRPYILEGRVEEEFGSITFTVDWLGFLDRYRREVFRSRKLNE
jgi:error-prone DNA polymerase